VLGLGRQLLAERMEALPTSLEHRCDRVLGKPVDLEVRVELAQLVGDGHVTLGMSETDR
jgi:hypothetical protein